MVGRLAQFTRQMDMFMDRESECGICHRSVLKELLIDHKADVL